MNGRVGVVHGRVAVGKNSCTTPINQLVRLVEFGRAWSGNLGDRDDRVDLIGSVNLALTLPNCYNCYN